jgi:hypothetical protein
LDKCALVDAYHGQRVLRTLLRERASTQPRRIAPTAGTDLVEDLMANGVVYAVVPAVQRELAA